MVSGEYSFTLYRSCQLLGPHNTEKLNPPSRPDSYAMTQTHSSIEPNPQHRQAAGFSHLDAFYEVRVATAIFGSVETLFLLLH